MMPLPKYTLTYDEDRSRWLLETDKSGEVIKSFPTKKAATKGGVLEAALGKKGGSVKIQKMNGSYQEERTFPRSRDPRGSKG